MLDNLRRQDFSLFPGSSFEPNRAYYGQERERDRYRYEELLADRNRESLPEHIQAVSPVAKMPVD